MDQFNIRSNMSTISFSVTYLDQMLIKINRNLFSLLEYSLHPLVIDVVQQQINHQIHLEIDSIRK